ncbi:MAG: hypothetical protein J1D89_05990 [Agathobacter sp.]|nr:hypothetical protein [Agathobacter sp.]
MSQIIKTFMCVFLILFMTAATIGILTAYLQVLGAQDLQAQIVDEIENSDYAPAVVRECFANAEKAGCELTVTYYYEGGGTVCCTDSAFVATDVSSVTMARVELSFPLEIRLFGFSKRHSFTGYAK